jgi:hypothetical protein
MFDQDLASFRKFRFPVSQAGTECNRHEMSAIWWLLLPVLFFAFRYLASIFTHKKNGLEFWVNGELGVVENLTVVLLVLAIVMTVCLLYRYGKFLHLAPTLFLVVYCLGCIYFAGEEASWGQHWFGWETGQYFLEINDQAETNLHNTSVLLDRTPKGIVSLLIFIGGIAIPLYLRRKALVIDCTKPLWWLFPTWICLPTAVFATVATWPSKIERATGTVFYFDGAQEVKELYIAYFFLIFIVSLYLRLRHYRANGTVFSAI